MTDKELKNGDRVSIPHDILYHKVCILAADYDLLGKDVTCNATVLAAGIPVVAFPAIDGTTNNLIVFHNASYGFSYDTIGDRYQEIIRQSGLLNYQKLTYCGIDSKLLTICAEPTNSQTKENTMSKLTDVLKSDATEAAYRVAGTQITSGVKAGLIKLFESKGGSSDQMETLKSVLDSEVGDSLISLILGFGLNYAPKLKDDKRIQKLSEEFRINGMAVAGNAIIGAAMESFLPVLQTALSALPEETSSNARVTGHSEEEEEDTAPPAKLTKTAGH